jgi:hypothetical protein
MPSLLRSLILITSAVCVVTAQGQRWTQPSKCSDAHTTDISTLIQCYNTVDLAVRLVDNAEGDFDEAYDAAEVEEGDEDSDIDYRFLRYLIKGEFDDQGVFYDDTAAVLGKLSDAVTALEFADLSPTNPALRSICSQLKLNSDLYRQFQLQPDALYSAACGGIFIPTPSSSTSCSTVSTKSTLSSAPTSSSASLTSPMPSSNATLSSSNSLTTPPPLAVTNSRSASSTTPCTTGASVSSVSVSAVSKRQAYGNSELEILIKKVASAIFAIGLIETNQDDSECQVDDYWVESYNYLGLYGGYIQDLM